MSTNNELIRGSIEIVILKLLSENDMYGYQMIKTVNERSNGFFEWREGSLYPCLHKLVGEKLVTSYTREAERMSTARQKHPDRTALAEAGVFAVSEQWMKAECGF